MFRARVALASNPICPSEIIDFLWENRASADWLLRGGEPEESGVLVLVDGRYSIDEDFNDLEQSRDDAAQILNFDFPSDENWESSPGAQYVKNLFDIEWQAEDATTCLLVAFAKNSSLTPERYHQLHKEKNPLVRYFLSKNPSIPIEIEKALEAEHPTLSFRGYDEKSSGAVDGDLLGDVWFDLGGSK